MMKKFIAPVMAILLSACGAKAGTQAESVQQDDVVVSTEEYVEAPAFTLNDMEGNPVSLSDFKGKWVVLDFWGSWCPWCIKGFPALKEAYKEYDGKFEVIGIDCGDSVEAWKESVKQHELPWIQVYNPKESDLTGRYGIQGFPTKFIINPEGKIANCTIGEDPAFFDVLKSLIK